MKHRIAILGASGYTGAELVRLIATHPSMEIVALSADHKAGQTMAEVFPFLRHLTLPRLQKIDEINRIAISVVNNRNRRAAIEIMASGRINRKER